MDKTGKQLDVLFEQMGDPKLLAAYLEVRDRASKGPTSILEDVAEAGLEEEYAKWTVQNEQENKKLPVTF